MREREREHVSVGVRADVQKLVSVVKIATAWRSELPKTSVL
jgi:hypothetical protein